MASQKEVARHLSLSQQAVSQLVASGVLAAPASRGGMDLDQCRGAYITHLREVAAGRSAGDPDAPNLVLERARLARAQADAQKRKNAEADDQLIDMDEASGLFFEAARTARDAWMNWPSRVAPLAAANLGMAADPLLEVLNEHVHQQLVDLGEPEFIHAREERRR